MNNQQHSFTIKVVRTFLESNISLVFIIITVALGLAALLITPREEEPQIIVPAADIYVSFPGHSAADVEKLVSTPLERYLMEVDGIEYIYSRSMPGKSIVTVRFYVGQDMEGSFVKLWRKMDEYKDKVPPGVKGWVIKHVNVDDVPIVTLTLTSPSRDDYQLRRIANELAVRLQNVKNAGKIRVVGGRPRAFLIRPLPEKLHGYNMTLLDLAHALSVSDFNVHAGDFDNGDVNYKVESGPFFSSADEVRNLVVGVWQNHPVYLRDVAKVTDGPGEFVNYVRFHRGRAFFHKKQEEYAVGTLLGKPVIPKGKFPPEGLPAVTISIAKQHGANNVWVAKDVIKKVEELKSSIIPHDVEVVVTRNYGVTANDKVNELIEDLYVAILVVIFLLTMGLGWRQALVVALAIPSVFGLTLIVNYLAGFSINRVVLFALTVALGLLVDDPIVDVENIHRHFEMNKKATRSITLEAVNEVRPPLIAATIAVIFSFIPLLFVTEMMGSYLRPMAVNVPVTMFMSIVVSFTITPWMAYHGLKGAFNKKGKHGAIPDEKKEKFVDKSHDSEYIKNTFQYKIFHKILEPILRKRYRSILLVIIVIFLFIGSIMLVGLRRVRPRQLPYDNKDEFLLVIDMERGTTLERTDAVVRKFEQYLHSVPEVTDYEAYVGIASPVDFQGMLRHYFLRHGPNRADIRVNLIHKTERVYPSHELTLRLRKDLTRIARENHVKLKIVELPPGPPSLSTVVAAVYGKPGTSYDEIIQASHIVKKRLKMEPGIVDVDDSVDEDQVKYEFEVDKEKAALNRVSTKDIADTIAIALKGKPFGIAEIPGEREPVKISIWLPRPRRSDPVDLTSIYVRSRTGHLVPISELGHWKKTLEDKTIYHRQMLPVVYVTGEVAGRPPVESIIDIRADRVSADSAKLFGYVESNKKPRPLEGRTLMHKGSGIRWGLPKQFYVHWWDEGEMHVTVDTFRDLGVAFIAAQIAIYILLVWLTGSFLTPLIIMVSIPLMFIGVMPGFWLLNQFGMRTVGGYPNPFFFTAPAMIGIIALSGIVTRNAIILVDFIHLGLEKGKNLLQAIVESCSVRLRPILLTAGAAILGALPITQDTVFGGMAWSMIFGLMASTLFTLIVVPVVYNLIYANKKGHGLPLKVRIEEEEEAENEQ